MKMGRPFVDKVELLEYEIIGAIKIQRTNKLDVLNQQIRDLNRQLSQIVDEDEALLANLRDRGRKESAAKVLVYFGSFA